MERKPLLHRLLTWGALTAAAIAVLVWPLKAYLASQAQRVVVVSEHDQSIVKVNEATFDPEDFEPDELRDEVISIYGSKLSEEDVLFVDDGRILRPKQVSGLTLLLKSADENPLKMDTVNFFTPKVSIGAGVAALLMLGLLRMLHGRRAKRAAAVEGASH